MAGAGLTFRPVTAESKADFVRLFEEPGGPKYCWCMAWRATGAEHKDSKGSARRQQMMGRIDRGVPVGLVGYLEGAPVAWVSIAPKETYRSLGGPETKAGEIVWSLACMYTHRNHRGQGLAHELIEAAVAHARNEGATIVEAYPVAPDSPSYRFMGFVGAFEAAGFEEVGMAGSRRHVMRRKL